MNRDDDMKPEDPRGRRPEDEGRWPFAEGPVPGDGNDSDEPRADEPRSRETRGDEPGPRQTSPQDVPFEHGYTEAPVDPAVEQQALDALRRLPSVSAPAIVRSRARKAFVRGPAVPEQRHIAPEPLRSGRVVVPLNPRRPNRIAPLAFAAAVVLMLLGYGAQAPEPWRITGVDDPEGVLRGQRDLAVGSIVPAGGLASPRYGEIEVSLGHALRMRLSPGTAITLPPPPRRWGPGTMSIEVTSGELFCSTTGRRLPATLAVSTEDLTARVTGTTFAVWNNPEGTCVCLLEGTVQVSARAGAAASASGPITVPEGNKVVMFNDGRPHLVEPISDMERMKLQMVRDQAPR